MAQNRNPVAFWQQLLQNSNLGKRLRANMAARVNPSLGRKGDKIWADAIRLAVTAKATGGERKLRLLADRLVAEGLSGDVSALKEIGDRLDGKARQEISGPEGGPIALTGKIEIELVRPSDDSAP